MDGRRAVVHRLSDAVASSTASNQLFSSRDAFLTVLKAVSTFGACSAGSRRDGPLVSERPVYRKLEEGGGKAVEMKAGKPATKPVEAAIKIGVLQCVSP